MAIDPKDPRVQEFLRQEKEKSKSAEKKEQPPKKEPEIEVEHEKKQHGLFKKTRAGVVLTKNEVKEIKKGRRELRKELRSRGIRSKREFELTAGSLGLYFDKNRAFLAWLRLHWLGALLGFLAALLLILFVFAVVTQVRGLFTINLSSGMFKEGFVLSDSVGFEYPTTQLMAIPAEGVPCVSITHIPTDVDDIDGEHNENYFAYTFYIRNEGDLTVSFDWLLRMTSESQKLSDAVWVLLYVDGELKLYAKPDASGAAQSLPAKGDDTRGFMRVPVLMDKESDQLELITSRGLVDYYRVNPIAFADGDIIALGSHDGVVPGEVHKYTVVLWLEGDDPECNDSLIGGHMGVEMLFKLTGEDYDDAERDSLLGGRMRDFWDNLQFWK